jgi:hypothetical protein
MFPIDYKGDVPEEESVLQEKAIAGVRHFRGL